MPKDTSDMLDWLKDDIKHIRDSLGNIYDKLNNHPKECPALQAFLKKPSNPPITKSFSLPAFLIKIGPLILAAALGLLGLGAYFGNNNNLQSEITEIQKTLKEIKKND